MPDLTTAALWAAPVLILAGCAAYAARVLRGHAGGRGRLGCLRRTVGTRILKTLLRAAIRAAPCLSRIRAARHHLTRRRYARRMRGPLPGRDQGIWYDRRRWLEVQDAWGEPAARTERSRT
jgi:hypothetical protein